MSKKPFLSLGKKGLLGFSDLLVLFLVAGKDLKLLLSFKRFRFSKPGEISQN
jgi:hypothetical protein